jgi:hypothetical protein
MSGTHAPNLVVTIDESEREALGPRVIELLDRIGVRGAEIRPGGAHEGLLFVWLPVGAKEPLGRLRILCQSQPELFLGTHQWTPIDDWTDADARHVAAYAEAMERRMPPDAPFQVEIHRGGHVDVEVEALLPEQQVHPPPPTRTLRIEILGARAGMSVLEPGDGLDVDEAMRAKMVRAFGDVTRR